MNDLLSFAEDMHYALLSTDRLKAEQIMESFPERSTFELIEKIVVPAMDAIGAGWEVGTVAISQMYMSAKICEELIGHIQKPQMQLRNNSVKLAIVVLDDFHLLGKQIIYAVLKGVGYQIIDYGRMDVDELIKHVIEDNIEVLLISTLMLRSALRVKLVHEQLKWHQLKTRIIVGGAPFRFDTELWQEVGADATAADTRDLLPILDTMTKELKCLA
jgi:methanogenic corrinoid protein MtbC1